MSEITNTGELTDTINNLTTVLDLPDGTFSKRLNADEVNNLFDAIENRFNALYVKLRQLEDLHNFTKKYIENEFAKNKTAFDDAIIKLDNSRDVYEDTTVKAETVSFYTGSVVSDRDGRSLDTADIIDGNTIVANSTTIASVDPVSAIAIGNEVPYRRTTIPAKNYKVFYTLETIPNSEVFEEIDFYFTKPTKINFLYFSAFNSEVVKCELIRNNKPNFAIDPSHNNFTPVIATGVHLKLTSGKTNQITVSVTEKKDSDTSLSTASELDVLNTIYEHDVDKNGGVRI